MSTYIAKVLVKALPWVLYEKYATRDMLRGKYSIRQIYFHIAWVEGKQCFIYYMVFFKSKFSSWLANNRFYIQLHWINKILVVYIAPLLLYEKYSTLVGFDSPMQNTLYENSTIWKIQHSRFHTIYYALIYSKWVTNCPTADNVPSS